jgi:hypothetical protein
MVNRWNIGIIKYWKKGGLGTGGIEEEDKQNEADKPHVGGQLQTPGLHKMYK